MRFKVLCDLIRAMTSWSVACSVVLTTAMPELSGKRVFWRYSMVSMPTVCVFVWHKAALATVSAALLFLLLFVRVFFPGSST